MPFVAIAFTAGMIATIAIVIAILIVIIVVMTRTKKEHLGVWHGGSRVAADPHGRAVRNIEAVSA